MKLITGIARGVAMACGIVAAMPSHAQQSDEKQIEEIVVSAQRRAENVQEVPIAISAFQGETLRERAVTDVSSLSHIAPSVTLDAGTPFSGSTAVLGAFIRGIGSNDFAMNIDPGVGVYLDGVYMARSIGANLDLPDIERVEILKGPQGTLFGRNTIGGAVSVVTRNPGKEFKAEGTLTLGSFAREDLRGYLSIPINDDLGASLAFSSKRRDGFLTRLNYNDGQPWVHEDIRSFRMAGYDQPSKEGGQNDFTARAKLLWHASDTVSDNFSADLMREDEPGMNSTLLHAYTASDLPPGALPLGVVADLYNACISGAPLPPGFCNGRGTQVIPSLVLGGFAGVNVDADPNNNRLPWGNQFVTGNKDTSYSTGPSFSKINNYGFNNTLDWELSDALKFKSISSYRYLNWASAQDLDGSPLVIADNSFSTVQHQLSQEFQLNGKAHDGAVQYVLGAYYFQEGGILTDFPIFGQGLLQIYGRNEINTQNDALFGQLDWRVNSLLGLTIGGRYTEEDKKIFMLQEELNGLTYKLPLAAADSQTPAAALLAIMQANPAVFGIGKTDPLMFGFPDQQHRKFNNFSGKLGVQLHASDELMYYASWSQGYKTGGWTTRFTVPNPDPKTAEFDPEKADTIELGAKSQFLNHRMQLNAAIYTTNYKNIQLNQQVGVSPTIKNQGDARISGGEVEWQALITNDFSLNANLSYLDATFRTVLAQSYLAPDNYRAGVFAGSELPKSPKWKYNLTPRWELFTAAGSSIALLADFSWTASMWNDTERTYLLKRAAATNLNLSMTYKRKSSPWDVTLGGTNLTDDRSLASGFSQPGTGILSGTYTRGREYYASFNYKL